MNTSIWQEIIGQIQAGTSEKSHPFRYATLATVGLETLPRLRTVVLREFDPQTLRLTFYTDTRSKKILHIKENNRVSLLLFHHENQLQIRIEGLAIRERSPELLQERWNHLHAASRLDYTSVLSPGTEITSPEKVDYMKEEGNMYFGMVHIAPFKIEYLKLSRPKNTRVRFSKRGSGWTSDYLVP